MDHVGYGVSDLAKSKEMYLAALKPLGYAQQCEVANGKAVGIGPSIFKAFFWLAQVAEGKPATTGVHLAFTCDSVDLVKAFYEAAIAAGFKDNGPPGPRDYSPTYYAAYVLDLDGNNIEAVFHKCDKEKL